MDLKLSRISSCKNISLRDERLLSIFAYYGFDLGNFIINCCEYKQSGFLMQYD